MADLKGGPKMSEPRFLSRADRRWRATVGEITVSVVLPVGADAVQLVEQHHNSVLNDIKAWRAKSSNTAFNAG
jgi:hypothetical protein